MPSLLMFFEVSLVEIKVLLLLYMILLVYYLFLLYLPPITLAMLGSRFATHEKKFRKDVDCIAASMV